MYRKYKMTQKNQNENWKRYAWFGLIVIILPFLISIYTRLWVYSAITIGFLFGFFLQKGQLCGSSAFSEVIIMKDRKKLWGLWVAIVTGMGLFAIGSTAGLHSLTVKPLLILNMIIGGIIFGAGTVLAGGCVSGCLYKSGEGNLNSIVALIGIAFGISSVEYGHLHGINMWMKKTAVIKTVSGGSVSISSLTGLPYWILAFIFIVITIFATIYVNKKSRQTSSGMTFVPEKASFEKIMTKRWKPWQAGIAIGLLGFLAYMSSSASGRNYPLGVSHGVLFVHNITTANDYQNIYKPKLTIENKALESERLSPKPKRKVVWWLVLLVSSLVLGSWVSAQMSGDVKLLPKPPDQILFAILGGVFVGIGAAIAGGCVVGNIISGWALMSVGCLIFGIFTLLSNWAMTWFYLMGGWE
jgi:hypothetical protein